MAGAPKNRSFLCRIEAQVAVTCRSCKAGEVWEQDALIAEMGKNGGNTDWNAAPLSLSARTAVPRRGSTCSRCPTASCAPGIAQRLNEQGAEMEEANRP